MLGSSIDDGKPAPAMTHLPFTSTNLVDDVSLGAQTQPEAIPSVRDVSMHPFDVGGSADVTRSISRSRRITRGGPWLRWTGGLSVVRAPQTGRADARSSGNNLIARRERRSIRARAVRHRSDERARRPALDWTFASAAEIEPTHANGSHPPTTKPGTMSFFDDVERIGQMIDVLIDTSASSWLTKVRL